jgi:hypothetical protein
LRQPGDVAALRFRAAKVRVDALKPKAEKGFFGAVLKYVDKLLTNTKTGFNC